MGWRKGYGSNVEHMAGKHKALGSIPGTANKNQSPKRCSEGLRQEVVDSRSAWATQGHSDTVSQKQILSSKGGKIVSLKKMLGLQEALGWIPHLAKGKRHVRYRIIPDLDLDT